MVPRCGLQSGLITCCVSCLCQHGRGAGKHWGDDPECGVKLVPPQMEVWVAGRASSKMARGKPCGLAGQLRGLSVQDSELTCSQSSCLHHVEPGFNLWVREKAAWVRRRGWAWLPPRLSLGPAP